jgi:serine/threonine protein kinase
MSRRVGRYTLFHRLGQGGVANVFLARRDGSNEACGLKLLRVEVEGDRHSMARFQREAQLASLLHHLNIARITDAQFEDGTSPEQAMAAETDRCSDLYTLGVVLYEMLAGQPCVPGGITLRDHARCDQRRADPTHGAQPCDSNTARESGDEGTRKVAGEAVSKRKCVSKRAARRQHVDRRRCGCSSHF